MAKTHSMVITTVRSVQAHGSHMTGLEAITVRTCPQALQAVTTHPADIDAVNLGGLESAWAWSQAGRHQVCFVGFLLIAALSALCCSVCFVPNSICNNTPLWVTLNAYPLRQSGELLVHGVRQDATHDMQCVCSLKMP